MSSYLRINFSSLGKKYLMAVTGLLLGSFLLFHAAGNSLILYNQAIFATYAEHLQSLGLLLAIVELLLAAVFIAHILTGFSLILSNRKAKGRKYAINNSVLGLRGWPSRIMPITGTVVLLFLLIHLVTLRFMDQAVPIAERIRQVLTNPLLILLYTAGMIAICLHISHGFWSLTQSLGMNHPRWNGLMRGLGWLATIFSIGIFIAVILLHILL